MESFSTQKSKSRKIKKLAKKKSRVQIILDLFFRAIEIIVVLATVAKLCYELVITFDDSGVAEVILVNRSLAFVVANSIVITLIAESGLILNQEHDSKCKSNDLYEEFVRESSRREGVNSQAGMRGREKHSEAENEAHQSVAESRVIHSSSDKTEKDSETEKKMKKKIFEKRVKQRKPEKLTKHVSFVNREKKSVTEHHDITVKKMEKQNLSEKSRSQSYQRRLSENIEGLKKSSCGGLKRSKTDASSERFYSDDELRYKIESFIAIARQRRNQNDE